MMRRNARIQENARSAAGSPRCPPRSSGRSPARAAAPRTRRAPPTSGPRKKRDRPAARAARSAAADAAVSSIEQPSDDRPDDRRSREAFGEPTELRRAVGRWTTEASAYVETGSDGDDRGARGCRGGVRPESTTGHGADVHSSRLVGDAAAGEPATPRRRPASRDTSGDDDIRWGHRAVVRADRRSAAGARSGR